MDSTLELIFIHRLLSFLLFFPPLINLYALFFIPSHTYKLKIMALVAPAYYTILSASIFSGLVSWAIFKFSFSWEVLSMILLWIAIFVYEIKRHKKQKFILREEDSKTREKFFMWARIKYIFDECAFIALFLWSI